MKNHHTILVHLHYGEKKQYQRLLESLSRMGIVDVVQQQDGKRFRLPQGQYYLYSASPSDAIREQVYEIATQIGKAAVVVTSGESIAWVGLEIAG